MPNNVAVITFKYVDYCIYNATIQRCQNQQLFEKLLSELNCLVLAGLYSLLMSARLRPNNLLFLKNLHSNSQAFNA